MAMFIISIIIFLGLFITWLILKILSKKVAINEAVSLDNKTLSEMSIYSTQNGWKYDNQTNSATRCIYKYNIDKNVIRNLFLSWLIAISVVFNLGIVAAAQNTCVEAKQYENKLEREKIVVRLKYYDNYGTNIYKNDTALREYTTTLNQVKDFNSKVYFSNTYENSIWIGIFIDKGYVGLEPIEYSTL